MDGEEQGKEGTRVYRNVSMTTATGSSSCRGQHRTAHGLHCSPGPQGWGSHRDLQLSGQNVLESPGWELPVSGSVSWKALVRQEIRREEDDVEGFFSSQHLSALGVR